VEMPKKNDSAKLFQQISNEPVQKNISKMNHKKKQNAQNLRPKTKWKQANKKDNQQPSVKNRTIPWT